MAKILEAAKERKAMAEKMSQATILDQENTNHNGKSSPVMPFET